MHLHQPDWKSREGTEDGGVDAGDYSHWADASYRWSSYNSHLKIKMALKSIPVVRIKLTRLRAYSIKSISD